MYHEKTDNPSPCLSKVSDSTQIHILINGHKAKLNFHTSGDYSAIDDIKRMMIGSVIKSDKSEKH